MGPEANRKTVGEALKYDHRTHTIAPQHRPRCVVLRHERTAVIEETRRH
ncbi:MAG: hypothetical protein FD124_1181, partial [Alphaproteobacteria bacterium]